MLQCQVVMEKMTATTIMFRFVPPQSTGGLPLGELRNKCALDFLSMDQIALNFHKTVSFMTLKKGSRSYHEILSSPVPKPLVPKPQLSTNPNIVKPS